LVLSYYVVLRSVVRLKPRLRTCLARCRHCGIFFLTDVRNAGRKDLGCPFGCRQAHRKTQSTCRSVDYYRQVEGKAKKRDLNARRRKTPAPPPSPTPAPVQPAPLTWPGHWPHVPGCHVVRVGQRAEVVLARPVPAFRAGPQRFLVNAPEPIALEHPAKGTNSFECVHVTAFHGSFVSAIFTVLASRANHFWR
jgi:hypothetical protein